MKLHTNRLPDLQVLQKLVKESLHIRQQFFLIILRAFDGYKARVRAPNLPRLL
jgi:hypothetical protein